MFVCLGMCLCACFCVFICKISNLLTTFKKLEFILPLIKCIEKGAVRLIPATGMLEFLDNEIFL